MLDPENDKQKVLQILLQGSRWRVKTANTILQIPWKKAKSYANTPNFSSLHWYFSQLKEKQNNCYFCFYLLKKKLFRRTFSLQKDFKTCGCLTWLKGDNSHISYFTTTVQKISSKIFEKQK
jgi:hypothetical protein